MHAIEFTTRLTGDPVLTVPDDVAAQLPKEGTARVIVLTDGDGDDADWRKEAYQQFLRDDVPEDAVYESLR